MVSTFLFNGVNIPISWLEGRYTHLTTTNLTNEYLINEYNFWLARYNAYAAAVMPNDDIVQMSEDVLTRVKNISGNIVNWLEGRYDFLINSGFSNDYLINEYDVWMGRYNTYSMSSVPNDRIVQMSEDVWTRIQYISEVVNDNSLNDDQTVRIH